MYIRTFYAALSIPLFMEENLMLVLSRKPGEKIHIGTGITVTVVATKGNKVRIGIDAPKDVPVLRSELGDFLTLDPSEPRPFFSSRS
jgi:carbon storage regulator